MISDIKSRRDHFFSFFFSSQRGWQARSCSLQKDKLERNYRHGKPHRWTASEILIDKDVSCRWGTVNGVKLETQILKLNTLQYHGILICTITYPKPSHIEYYYAFEQVSSDFLIQPGHMMLDNSMSKLLVILLIT